MKKASMHDINTYESPDHNTYDINLAQVLTEQDH